MPEISLPRLEGPRTHVPALFFRFAATSDQLVLAAGVFWALAVNRPFLAAASRAHASTDGWPWSFVLGLTLMLAALHVLLAGLVATRWTVKPLLARADRRRRLSRCTSCSAYGAVLDPSMLRNVLHTDVAEARELLSLAPGAAPAAVCRRCRCRCCAACACERRPWRAPLASRAPRCWAGALAPSLGALLVAFQPLASLMRNHKEVRYLITPANVPVVARPAWRPPTRAAPPQPRQADRAGRRARAVLGHAAASRCWWCWWSARPRARANWGLNGYARQTTPELAAAAGAQLRRTSAPAAPTPRSRCPACSRRSAGATTTRRASAAASRCCTCWRAPAWRVHWRDNQSGCKGVCDGLPNDSGRRRSTAPGLCADGHCLDEGLLHGLDERLARRQRHAAAGAAHAGQPRARRTSAATRRPSRASSRRAATTTCAAAARERDRQRLRQRAALHRPRAGAR